MSESTTWSPGTRPVRISTALADTPDQGSFGAGATFGGSAVFGGGGSVGMDTGLNASYFLTRNVNLGASLGFTTTSNVGTAFDVQVVGAYYFMRDGASQISPLVFASAGLVTASPTQGSGRTAALFAVGGGLEYFVSRNFGVRVMEGLGLGTNPTTFALVSRLSLTLYI